MRQFAIPVSLPRILTLLAFASVVGVVGARQSDFGHAATTGNPYGTIDSCVLSGTTTVLSGWAADPSLTTATTTPNVVIKAGSNAVTSPTNLAYRTTAINNYINTYHPGDPKPGEYGFTAKYAGLYKGSSYIVSGTIINVGTGVNVAIKVNQTSVFDGVSHNVFTGGKIPDACLNAVPAPPPAPTPTPTPTPTPAPIVKYTPSAPPAPSSAADSTSTIGTSAAGIKIPAGNATKIHLNYGVTSGPQADTPDQAVSGSDTTITLTGLQAKTPYTYKIVRTNSAGVSATSAETGFTTSGYSVTLHFTDKNGKAVSNIVGNINDANGTQVISDSKGYMSFTDLDAGTYTVTYTYLGKTHTDDFDTSSTAGSPDAAQPKVVELTDAINVDALLAGQTSTHATKTKRRSPVVPVLWALFVLALLGAAVWFWRRWRRSREIARLYAPIASMSGGMDVIDQHSLKEFAKQKPQPGPAPEHMGESLRDMVLQSMQNGAIQQPTNPNQAPLPPLPPEEQQPPQEPPRA